MDNLLGFIVTLVCILVKPGDAIECHECLSSTIPGSPFQQQGCFDPFNNEGIATITCEGQCFANYTSASFGFPVEQVQRGCTTDSEECFGTFCQESDILDLGPSKYCSYCCDEELCNSIGFDEIAVGTLSCWLCDANITEGIDPSSCAGDNFTGEGAFKLPCPMTGESPPKCSVTQSPSYQPEEPDHFSRGCANEDLCAVFGLLGYEVDCCDDNLCNVGSNIKGQATTERPGMMETTPQDDDNKEGTIECWRCDSEVTIDGDCFGGIFPAHNVLQIDCPSGTCISYTAANQSQQVFARDCLTPEMKRLGYCDGSNSLIKDAECCTKNLCNGKSSAARITLNAATMFSAVFVSVLYMHAFA